jgi:beta-galactosidase/beta-glucuronidase
MPQPLPRPEYPRPLLVREEWLNLNGEWEFAFDDGDRGVHEEWFDGRELPLRIVVPFPYQCERSGINDRSIHEVVWYARSLEVPEGWADRDVVLHFGAVDYRTIVWVNGLEVGHNQGGHVPFDFNVTPYLRTGENRVVLRVEDRQDPKQPRGKQSSTGLPYGIDYYCTTGIWQTVWMEPVREFHLDSVRILPREAEGELDVTVFIHAPAVGWRVEVQVLDGSTVVAEAATQTPSAVACLRLGIPEPKRWSPESPHLYDLVIRLRDGGELLDEVRCYAGLRSVCIQDGRLFLNGQPIYLAMVLDQGYWPESYLRADVEWAKRFGFNGARKHQKIEDPRWLYWCDRLGLLVWEEMPNARDWSSHAEEQLLAEWERAVCRDANHPCIITWVPVNESMGFPHLKEGHPGQYAFLERMVLATRSLDSTRPVIDNDGWEHTHITDILAIHDYSHNGQLLRDRYAETVRGGPLPPRTWTGSRAIFAGGAAHHGQPVMLTEVGGFLDVPDVPAEERDRIYRIYASVSSGEELLRKYRDLMEGIRDLPFVSGFCYTQLTDIEQELNGLLTYDRRPKVDPAQIAKIHRRLFADRYQNGAAQANP